METAKSLLAKLQQDGSHIEFDVAGKIATLHSGETGSPQTAVALADLLFIFEKGWIGKIDTSGGRHRYCITEAGRMAIRG